MSSRTTRSGRSGSIRVRRARRFLLPLAAASAALVLPSPAPLAQATPAACADPCTINSSFYAYIAPVTEVASGTDVSWDSIDFSHPTAEQVVLGGGAPCFSVPVTPGNPSAPVSFAIVDGGVTATAEGGSPKACSSAIALGDVGYVLPYQCIQHPQMQAALLVTPA